MDARRILDISAQILQARDGEKMPRWEWRNSDYSILLHYQGSITKFPNVNYADYCTVKGAILAALNPQAFEGIIHYRDKAAEEGKNKYLQASKG